MRWAVPVTGMIALVLGILPRTFASSGIVIYSIGAVTGQGISEASHLCLL